MPATVGLCFGLNDRIAQAAMTLHAVLLNWNQGPAVRSLLDRLTAWSRPATRIWVVDNASTDPESASLPAAFPPVHFLRNDHNLGYAGGINTALRAIRDEAGPDDTVLLLNNDIDLAPACVDTLAAALDAHPEAAMAGPVLIEGPATAPRRSWGGRDIGRHLHTRLTAPPRTIPDDGCYPVDYVPGTVLLFRASLLSTIGLLDEEYFFSGEIADYAARARRAGAACLVCARAEARHAAHDDHGQRGTLYRYYSLRNRFLYVRKHEARRGSRARVRWALLALAAAGASLLRADPPAARAALAALRDGWRGRFGNRNARFES